MEKQNIVEKIKSRLNKIGEEIFHKKPRVGTIKGLTPPLTLEQRVMELMKSSQMAQLAEKEGYETFEESEDFDVGEDLDDPLTEQPFQFDEAEEHRVKKGLRAADLEIAEKKLNGQFGRPKAPSQPPPAAQEPQDTSGSTKPASAGKADQKDPS